MKTAISVDDKLLGEADRTAEKMGVSRSRLFSLALEDYLRRRRQEGITEQLNRVYSADPDHAERRIAAAVKNKLRRAIQERW
jgi:metal-responsive CopG/Arc/MetJ family transcriptional regulator